MFFRIMHTVSKVSYALNKTAPRNFEDSPNPSTFFSSTISNTAENKERSPSSGFLSSPLSSPPDYSQLQPESMQPSNIPDISTTNQAAGQNLFTNLPTFQQQIDVFPSYNFHQVYLDYWETGMVYSDPEVNFKIESLSASTKYPDNKDGVLIIASPNEKGMKIIGHLIDLVASISNI